MRPECGRGIHVKQPSDSHQRETKKQHEHPTNAGVEEREIDRALADSFPASDAPPWTLGVTPALSQKRRQRKYKRA
jgi:hypothetical protein